MKRSHVRFTQGLADQTISRLSAAAAAAMLASATEVEDISASPLCPDGEHATDGLFEVISPRSAVSVPGTTVNSSRSCSPLSTTTSG